ncbi:hypothetical protein HFD88_002227 [Aspergillus terreus]|uniref:ENOG410PXBM ankyrin repeat protein n=1 Tax=Aspergillus terreus var. terreus TaxID=2081996 RepID=A0A7D7L996_ASPTE|nr:hypothetical protein HFD88_002227 [Aspergillus terreus]QMS79062.1 ENOG410PXBM ankyrin repeat protein [Aspergillus terreus var. terreus]
MADMNQSRVTRRRDFPLVTAIQNHDLATVRHLLDRKVSPNEPYDAPPLIHAIQHKALDIVQLLYEYHVQGYVGEHGDTEIHVAASFGHLPILEFIWHQQQGDSGQRGNLHRSNLSGQTPLHHAAASGSLDCVRFLLHEGADVNASADHGMTPLHCAAKRPRGREIAELLLEAGAQADAVTSEGESAIFTAIASHSDVISVLLRAGASLSPRKRYNETVAHLVAYHGPLSLLPVLMDAGVEMTARSTTSSTILHRAAEAGHLDTIQWILQHTGLAADEANDYGWTPLHFAVTGNHLSTVKFLVEQGADVAAVTRIPKNASALHLAAYFSGADVKLSIADETALLSYLLAQGTIDRDVSVLAGASGPGEMLLEHFYVDSENGVQDQVTPLDCAAEIGSIPKVQLLLAAGADINAQSPGKGWTVLHREAEPDAMMRFLIQNGADYRAAKPIRDLLVETGVYTEDLEGDMDWRVVAPLMKGVRRFSAVHF